MLAPALLQDQVDLQDLVEGDGRVVNAVAGRLAVAAYRIEAIADRAESPRRGCGMDGSTCQRLSTGS